MTTVQLGEIASINPDTPVYAGVDDMCPFVPMNAVSEHDADITVYSNRPYKELAKGYVPFMEQDVLLAKITPCMENGKCAIARGLRRAVGFGSTEFHVVRASPQVFPEWIYYFWRLPATRLLAERNMTVPPDRNECQARFFKLCPSLFHLSIDNATSSTCSEEPTIFGACDATYFNYAMMFCRRYSWKCLAICPQQNGISPLLVR